MTIEQLREKIVYRTNKMNWCISVGRETQAEWNRDQIARLEESIRIMEQDAVEEAWGEFNQIFRDQIARLEESIRVMEQDSGRH